MTTKTKQSEAELSNKISGLEADLFCAVGVAYRRGATEWTRQNYPEYYERLSAENVAPDENPFWWSAADIEKYARAIVDQRGKYAFAYTDGGAVAVVKSVLTSLRLAVGTIRIARDHEKPNPERTALMIARATAPRDTGSAAKRSPGTDTK